MKTNPYVVAEAGAYRFDAPGYKLVEIADRNIKGQLARQGHVAAASQMSGRPDIGAPRRACGGDRWLSR